MAAEGKHAKGGKAKASKKEKSDDKLEAKLPGVEKLATMPSIQTLFCTGLYPTCVHMFPGQRLQLEP